MVALRCKKSVVAVIASFAAVSAAYSADPAIPPLAPVQNFSGWYLRGGDAAAGTMAGFTGNADTSFEFRQLTSHDVSFGVRFNFGAYDLLPPPPPLRTKG